MSIHCQSLLSPRQARTNVHFTHTHSLPITTGSGQTTTHYSSSYLCISNCPTIRFDLCKSHHRVTQTHITHSTRINYPGQSNTNTSPKLRWTGNSPIWGKITVPTGVSSIYDYPGTHTDLAYANLTSINTPTLQLYLPPQPHRSFKRTIDHMIDRYILLWRLENSSLEYTRDNYQPYS